MKHRRNRRLANFTKSAVTIGILLPGKSAAPLPLPSLYISRSVSSANFAKKCVHSQHRSSEVEFFDIFQKWDKSKCHQNYANEPCFSHLLTYRSSKHQHITCSRRGTQSHTIHMSFTTVDVYVFA